MKIIKVFFEFVLGIFFKILFAMIGQPRLSKDLRKAIDLYEERGFGSLFAKIRSWDAPYAAVEKLVPKSGRILDLGSGDGLMVNFLAIAGKKRKLLGVELNSTRVKDSDKGLKNTRFVKGNILDYNFPKAETVLLIHVLHHLPSRKSQEELIKKISGFLKKSGKLIILEIDYKPFIKYVISFLTDAVIVPVLFEDKLFSLDFHYRAKKEWRELLENDGFIIKKMKVTHKGMPFSHVLFSVVKK